jgi:ADP-ribose pyrophosphatase YjhB (NUDIX family)
MHHHDPTFRFCPVCGGRLAWRRLRAADRERLVCTACGFVFYLDPKVAVGTIIAVEDERLVLVRRQIEPGAGKWVFPGGYVDRGESLLEAAAREAREECGLDIRIDRLVNLYSYPGRPVIVVVYAATALGGTLRPDEESSEAALFARTAIPWDDLAFQSTRDALRDYLQLAPASRG